MLLDQRGERLDHHPRVGLAETRLANHRLVDLVLIGRLDLFFLGKLDHDTPSSRLPPSALGWAKSGNHRCQASDPLRLASVARHKGSVSNNHRGPTGVDEFCNRESLARVS